MQQLKNLQSYKKENECCTIMALRQCWELGHKFTIHEQDAPNDVPTNLATRY
jgi:hypothetical protein